jgi:twinkle protein
MEKPHWTLDQNEVVVADRWIDEHHVFLVPEEDTDATLDWLLNCMEVAVLRHGARIIVVDPWNELEHVREGRETETEYTGRAIRTFKRFSKKFQVHLILVAHPAKMQKINGIYLMPSLYDISGSANYYNKADIGIVIHRENDMDTIFKVQKSRYHDMIGVPGEVIMSFSKDTRRYIETGGTPPFNTFQDKYK